ncbi:MAG: (d)CMP kinase [Fidelibacterota bacterium]|nr:MAG: (d)CMP kinase [Candidatus Neomarinimicrobiota bacterium]
MTKVVTIDGPAASGKSTTARLAARRLGFIHLDTGAMYRAVTLACQEKRLPPRESSEMANLLASLDIRFQTSEKNQQRTLLNERDVTDAIRTPEVTRQVSAYSALGIVRERMVVMQRLIGTKQNVVCEGRDIGTHVFPDARFKFFLVADLEERARRRCDELRAGGHDPSLEHVVEELRQRDREDSTRELSPLQKAGDAITVDTTNLTIPAQVDFIVTLVMAAQKQCESESIK